MIKDIYRSTSSVKEIECKGNSSLTLSGKDFEDDLFLFTDDLQC